MDQDTTGKRQEDWRQYEGASCSTGEAARLLEVSPRTVQRMIEEGVIYAWRPNPLSRKRRVWIRQIQTILARAKAKAIRDVQLLQSTLPLDF